MSAVNKLYGKIIFTGKIVLKTGMHIGGSSDFSAIGAVDNVVIKDTLTKLPIIPGSSIKGKLRYLLARVISDTPQLKEIKNENPKIKRLFGGVANGNEYYSSRLQFSDMLLNKESAEKIKKMEPDLYVTEIKFENTINRLSAIANPRQIERVPAGAEFDFHLAYNIETIEEVEEDLENTSMALYLLENDYLGGHGTRGYGRLKFEEIKAEYKIYGEGIIDEGQIEEMVSKKFIIEKR